MRLRHALSSFRRPVTVNVVRRDPGCKCDLKTLDAFGCTEGCECYKCHLEDKVARLLGALAAVHDMCRRREPHQRIGMYVHEFVYEAETDDPKAGA